jgi:hypothetical protein
MIFMECFYIKLNICNLMWLFRINISSEFCCKTIFSAPFLEASRFLVGHGSHVGRLYSVGQYLFSYKQPLSLIGHTCTV